MISAEWQKSLAKKKSAAVKQERVDEVFGAIASALLPFGSWNALRTKKLEACRAIDAALSAYAAFPSLADMCSAGAVNLPANSTIAFDSNAECCLAEESLEPYAVVAMILKNYSSEDGAPDKYVQQNLTTANSNGLAWLFAAGLDYWRKNSAEDIAAAYGVPDKALAAVERVRAAALAIPAQNFLWKGGKALNYGYFRRYVGGRLDSWVANYVKRLEELKGILSDMPEALSVPTSFISGKQDFLDTTDCKRSEIELLCKAFNTSRTEAAEAVAQLLGKAGSAEKVKNAVDSVIKCSGLLNRLYAVRDQLANAMEQAAKDADSPWCKIGIAVKEEFAQWNALKKLPKLNGMTGGVPNAESELENAERGYRDVTAARERLMAHLRQWLASEGLHPDAVAFQEKVEQKRLSTRNAVQIASAPELAIRYLLNAVGRLVRDRSDECAKKVIGWFDANGIFQSRKDRNQYFCNHLGSLYVSPFSGRRHQGYRLGSAVVAERSALWTSLSEFVSRLSYAPYTEASETLLRLTSLIQGRMISAIDRDIPKSVAQLGLGEEYMGSLPEGLKLQLSQEAVSPAVFSKAVNIYTSLLTGFAIVLRRNRFFLRTKFTWFGNQTLCLVPKERQWRIPSRYQSSPRWTGILKSGILVYDENGVVDTAKTFANVASALRDKKRDDVGELGELLRQLPHDWCYELPFISKGKTETETEVLKVAKDGAAGTKIAVAMVAKAGLARLIGPSSLKSRLDAMLIDSSIAVGDMILLVDQPVRQGMECGKVKLEEEAPILTLAIPMALRANKSDEASPKPFTRIVAIDQGEAGLAYAVFNLSDWGKSDANPIAAGTFPIRSIRRLIRGVRHYRQKGQSVQKFNQRFDSTMFTLRENVAGDVCGVIEGLMSRFHAFPILENEVRNLASGSKQLALVYKMVNARFLFSDVDMQNAERISWWCGAGCWMPEGFFREVPPEEAKKKGTRIIGGKTFKPLRIFPGAGVRAAMTSRICSHCGRNVFDLLSQARDNGVRKVHVDAGGEVQLGSETLKLYSRPSEEASRAARRRNERADWTEPMPESDLNLDALTKRIKENLRRPPRSRQSRDTTQSRYFCVFKDCEWNRTGYHADVNAAVNIGRRFLASVRFEKEK